MLIYYAHPIDQANTNNTDITNSLRSRGATIYDPGAAWTVSIGQRPTPALQRANLDVLRRCDGLVAYLKPDILSIGVTLELVEAANNDIPAIVYGDLRPSWALAYLGIDHTDDIQRVWGWLEGIKRWN